MDLVDLTTDSEGAPSDCDDLPPAVISVNTVPQRWALIIQSCTYTLLFVSTLVEMIYRHIF